MTIPEELHETIVVLLRLLGQADTQGACDTGGYLGDALDIASALSRSLGLDDV